MRRPLTNDGPGSEFGQVLDASRRSLWRWEQQPAYDIGTERGKLDLFLAGHPEAPTESPDLVEWFGRVREKAAAGMTVGRVRVVDVPPTDYQRWLRWTDRWNREAGEVIDYLSRPRLGQLGRPPFDPDADWWFVDEQRLVVINYDDAHKPVLTELVENEPEIEMAKQWQQLVIAEARRAT
jgi:hypothetical protein